MDRAAISNLNFQQLMHLLLTIIHEVCTRLRINIDHTSVFTFQFPAESFAQLDNIDIEIARDPVEPDGRDTR